MEQVPETAAPEGSLRAARAAMAQVGGTAEQGLCSRDAGNTAHGPQNTRGEAAQEAHTAAQADSDPTPARATTETGTKPKMPAQQRGQRLPDAPTSLQVPHSIVLLPEPYINWRERLVGLFRALVPDKAEGRYVPGHVGQVYVQRPLSESYLVSAKYDVNVRGGGTSAGCGW